MSALKNIWIVLSKEVGDNLRDRRSLVSSLSSSLIGPGILLLLIVIIGKTLFADSQEQTFDLPLVGGEYAPELVEFLEQNGAVIQPGPEDPEEAVRNGDLEAVLVIPGPEFGEDFSLGNPAEVVLVQDSSRQSAMITVQRARNLLESYGSQITVLRLMARGIDPAVLRPLLVEQKDVSTPQTQALLFLNMMPYFVVLVVFVGGMYVVIDATAGERERGSLEPLLINPVKRAELVLGKLSAALPFATASLLATLIAFGVAFNVFPVEDYVGIQLTLSVPALVGVFLISLPMILLATGLQMIIATATKSFKEAQTYTSLLALVPALPGLALAFLSIKPSPINMLIPTFGQQILINQLMRGEQINPWYVLITTVSTLAVSGLLVWVSVRLYEREQIIFGPR